MPTPSNFKTKITLYPDQIEEFDDECVLITDYSLEDDNAKNEILNLLFDDIEKPTIQHVYGNAMLLKNIKTEVVTKRIESNGSRDTVAVSNFRFSLPHESRQIEFAFDLPNQNPSRLAKGGKKQIVIAVMDTGIDVGEGPGEIPSKFLWEGTLLLNGEEKTVGGKNFVHYDTPNHTPEIIKDDSYSKHGTLVTAFILNQFKDSDVEVKIMNLKTHDENGVGNLYSIYNAIKFAKSHGAHIINASWGFYESFASGSTQDPETGEGNTEGDEESKTNTFELFRDLILTELKDNDILFITAAGNASIVADQMFAQSQSEQSPNISNNPRDVAKHPFYPAFLNSEPEVEHLLVSTSVFEWEGELRVCPRQNFSKELVSIGIKGHAPILLRDGDKEFLKEVLYRIPVTGEAGEISDRSYVSGSSFSSAILTGKIGSQLPDSFFGENPIREVSQILSQLNEIDMDLGLDDYIQEGRYLIQ